MEHPPNGTLKLVGNVMVIGTDVIWIAYYDKVL